jgi:hypothetical protein
VVLQLKGLLRVIQWHLQNTAFYRETQRRWIEGSLGLNVSAVSLVPWHFYFQLNNFILPLYVIAKKKKTDDNFTSVTAKFVEKLEAKVRATAWNGTINYPLPEPDACKTLVDSACPLESGDLATYELALHLISILPTVSSH